MNEKRKPFTKRERDRMTQNGIGYRPKNGWGSGDLPAPFAEGDVVRLVGGHTASRRRHDRAVLRGRYARRRSTRGRLVLPVHDDPDPDGPLLRSSPRRVRRSCRSRVGRRRRPGCRASSWSGPPTLADCWAIETPRRGWSFTPDPIRPHRKRQIPPRYNPVTVRPLDPAVATDRRVRTVRPPTTGRRRAPVVWFGGKRCERKCGRRSATSQLHRTVRRVARRAPRTTARHE